MATLRNLLREALDGRCLCEQCLDATADELDDVVARLLRSTDPADQGTRDQLRDLLSDLCRHCSLPIQWEGDRWEHRESRLTVCNPSRVTVPADQPLPVATPLACA